MKPCTRVGIEVTGRCNANCVSCFHRWSPEVKARGDKTLAEVLAEAADGQRRGCDHVVIVGSGEPGIWPHLLDAIREFTRMGLSSSMISNATLPVSTYEKVREAGMNHLHLSIHNGFNADIVMGQKGATQRQQAVVEWLGKEKWAWRANMTIMKGTYDSIIGTALKCFNYGCRHIVSLGFLPLYGWAADFDRARQVIVDPKESSPYISELAGIMESQEGVTFTIRYAPMCLLPKQYWKYVTNARYVVYDPWEWEYQSSHLSPEALWTRAKDFGDSVGIQGEPCASCDLQIHCGSYNRTMFAMFPDMGICAIEDENIPKIPGWLFDQNPATHEKGWY
ncbi:MAG: radical SAM protein [Thiothrix sp.]|uniref:radical SAM protein n=1 Tax=Thiothrix sp. TaxID=1032 RepID=UPI00260AB5DA|nr:radical SAM protein [Thiothrix sp.]MDD5394917.1 radical SAM protein [Thiothrix sp.]